MRLRTLLAALVLFGLPLCSSGASAALLFSGGEDADFLCNSGGSCSVDTSSPDYRHNWAREAYEADGTASDPTTNRFATPVLSANATLWVHAQYCTSFSGCPYTTTTAGAQMLRIMDSNGNPTLIVRGTGTVGQLEISSRTAAGTFTNLVQCPGAINNALEQIDLYVNYGVSGEVALYNNSIQVCDYTGNVTNGDGATTLNQIEFGSPYTSHYGAWSEVIVATTDTRAMARFTANTVADGATVGFSGTNVCSAIWKAGTYNDASYGYTGSSNVTHECTINNAIPPGAYAVQGVTMSARALVGATGPLHFDFVTRTGGTDYASPDVAPTTTFSNFTNYIQTVNPATSAPWSISDIQDTGFNVGEKTKP